MKNKIHIYYLSPFISKVAKEDTNTIHKSKKITCKALK